MMRKSLIGALAVMGLVAASTMASTTPASAGYACGPWNGWCSWYGKKPYGWKSYSYRHWDHYGHKHSGGKHIHKGHKKRHAHKRSNRRFYR
jgi:hypothetical protein